jgi:hypothetical protein
MSKFRTAVRAGIALTYTAVYVARAAELAAALRHPLAWQ